MQKQIVSKCLFPVAGLGTRFLPATKDVPKEMLPLVNRPILSYGVEEAIDAGCTEMVMISSRSKRSIEDYFDRTWDLEKTLAERGKKELLNLIRQIPQMARFIFTRQAEPLGLGHAVLCGESLCSGDYFGVILPDDVMIAQPSVLAQLIEVHESLGGNVIALEMVSDEDTSRYGIVEAEKIQERVFQVCNLVEKPGKGCAPSNLAIMGRYVLSPRIFSILKEVKPGAGGEIQLTDGLIQLAKEEPLWGVVYKGRRLDCGTQKGWLQANIELALKDPSLRDIVLQVVEEYKKGEGK
ncbi:UTP--glucose-1-phosphate uridylyltransferase GalU [Aminobacterium sp. EBM-42]|jgi:UTP--glucose-1-phosphate uridylyltransferase|uniref:UTP--glucose-1-phosphate uridylyltransferase GalU n=1 Tax=Aminobacterium sp. EBM-42 TaxID=1918503 RepID=UPI000B14661E|nr:UTP--glucose-1-phosphate uridylyltransferase GalU [Aminobacterium sp. EBM-42]MDD2379327.1 UTP--glucose-1-phosphate uridylyltransferase GalU [Aminobacterium colombiense]MDD3768469.1 UTP--glucose-1-phosphate uridylyltransferase GalU [Aminobacterium colombiense]MDD4586197.1 UTP--glucose-1-phosphate uridylyltransferase GalU [Aminobacterium colombiense]